MSFEIRPREPVLLAEDFGRIVDWYSTVLGFHAVRRADGAERYAVLETAGGTRMGVADAGQVGITPGPRSGNTFVLQIEVDDVVAFLEHVAASGGAIVYGPAHDASGDYWCGTAADPEGNQIWVVDRNCL